MRLVVFVWILFGLLLMITFPVRADFDIDKVATKVGAVDGKEIEKDLYCYIDWQIDKLVLELTNRLSWPENNLNYSKFNVKAYLEDYRQLKLDLDYQWNERYRIFSPELTYKFTLWKDLMIKLGYENKIRTPVLEEDREKKYALETKTVSMEYEKKAWNYMLKLLQAGKDCPDDKGEVYDKNQLDQRLTWRAGPNLKVILSHFEATTYYPYSIDEDDWRSEIGIKGEYQINDQWQATSSFSVREEEKGLVPYLEKKNVKVEVKTEPIKDLDIRFKVNSGKIDYYSEIPYFDPDGILSEDDDRKSRLEKSALLECRFKYRKFNLTTETGFFWASKQYRSSQVKDFESNGLYATLGWNPGKFGIELEIAPEGKVQRKNGFYQLKMEYCF
jgi:hypothetical protein